MDESFWPTRDWTAALRSSNGSVCSLTLMLGFAFWNPAMTLSNVPGSWALTNVRGVGPPPESPPPPLPPSPPPPQATTVALVSATAANASRLLSLVPMSPPPDHASPSHDRRAVNVCHDWRGAP